jgi:uncharacterized protein with PQ loop repeat
MKPEIPHNHWIDKIALFNGFAGGIALYPQLFLLITSKVQSTGFSFVSFCLILSNSMIWLWYGVHRRIYPLIVSSLLNVLASGLILLLI